MKIKILTFGVARDITGNDQIVVDLPAGATVSDLQANLRSIYPAFQRLSSLLIAVNTSYASAQTTLHENDEVAIIPPVSGG